MEVQEPVGGHKIVINNDMLLAYASALLDHLEDLGTNVQSHHRRLRVRHYCYVMQAVVSVSFLGDKSLLHAKLMNTALTQLLVFRFSCLLTNKGIAQYTNN